ncbi:condensation domain-containing protein [Kitasatospora sp. NPDC053057]|uniref:condensation domain-containing protein n=1 Tax=Kitasatospora sp. NPDC053057 TaxID=3364062 RepID=UPI0037C8358F
MRAEEFATGDRSSGRIGRAVPLSTAQERMWFADAAAPGNATYNVPLFFRSREPVDAAVLAVALETVVARHAVLRTCYRLVDGQPVQVVADAVRPMVEEIDLGGLPDAAEQALAQARERGREPFDLSGGPVLRCTLWRGVPGGDAVLLVVHHIAVDGWSLAPLFEELAAAYLAARSGQAPRLPELPIQYGEFAVRERAESVGVELREQISQRAKQLAEVAGGLTLAGCRPNPAAPDGSRPGDQQVFTVPDEVVSAAAQLARSLRATPYIVFSAAVQALLHRWSGRGEFLLGSMTANRQQAELERLIGFFVNTVPVHCVVTSEQSFRELCVGSRTETFHALRHQRIPFDLLTAAVGEVRGGGRSALVEIGFVLQNMIAPTADDRLRWQPPLVLGTGTAKFDLLLIMEDGPDGLTLTVEHDTDRYPAEAVRELGEGFVSLLTAAVADPELPIGALPGGPDSFRIPQAPADRPAPVRPRAAAGPLDAQQLQAAELFTAALDAGAGSAAGQPSRLAAEANFFSLGGHSLLAVTMLAEAQRRHGIVVPPREFLADPTVAGLGRLLARGWSVTAAEDRPDAIPDGGPHPANAVQQRFWTIDRIPSLRSAYLIPTVVEYTGPVDPEALQRAVDTVLARHPALRSRFALDRRLRRVAYRTDGAPASASVIDASAWSAGELREHLAEVCWRGFDLAADAPARAELLTAGDRTLLVLVIHHIVSDGWSRQLLLAEVAEVYRAGTEGRDPVLTDPVHPATVTEVREDGPVAALAEAVTARLRGVPTDIELPRDRPRGELQGTEAVCRTVALGEELARRVRRVATEELGCSAFVTAAALLATTLGRRSGQRDFLFAFPWAGREDARSVEAVGMFVNTLVLRVDLSDGPTWRELLTRVREESVFAYRHAEVPFDMVVAALHPDRDLSRPPLTPVYLSSQEGPDSPPPLGPGITAGARALDPLHLKYELEFVVTESGEDLELALSYAVDLFDAATVTALLDDLVVDAGDLAADPDSHPMRRRPLWTTPK